jgi:hypothetical protein
VWRAARRIRGGKALFRIVFGPAAATMRDAHAQAQLSPIQDLKSIRVDVSDIEFGGGDR